MDLVLLIIGLILGSVICYFCLKPKINNTNSINEDIKKQNDLLENKNQELQFDNYRLQQTHRDLYDQTQELVRFKALLEGERDQITKSIKLLQEQADESNKVIYTQSYELMQECLSQKAEKLGEEFQEIEENYRQEYLKVMEESAEELAAALASKSEEIRIVNEQLAQLRAKADAAIAAAKREEEKALEIDKYKIIISDLDLLEINRLREIAPYFRNARPVYKILWESYYRNATNELLNRIVGSGVHSGIYKITNLKNQKVYIGQSVNLRDRIIQHIKCSIGIDMPNNILYAATFKEGIENFSFEILEECEQSQLNDRETYFIEFYRAQEHGYNMGRGGSRK